MTKDDIIKGHEPNGEYNCYYHESKIEVMMDEYAKQQCITFLNWTNDNVSDQYFDDGEWYYELKYSGVVVNAEKLYTQFLNTL